MLTFKKMINGSQFTTPANGEDVSARITLKSLGNFAQIESLVQFHPGQMKFQHLQLMNRLLDVFISIICQIMGDEGIKDHPTCSLAAVSGNGI